MSASLKELEIRGIIDAMQKNEPNITTDNIIKSIRAKLESQGVMWNEDLERKIKYCALIHPN
jgi:hypothetical protein